MQILSLFIGLLALFVSVENMIYLFRFRSRVADMLTSIAKTVAKLGEEREAEPERPNDAGKVWEEAINNLMSYELKGYGLNLEFLQKEDELNG